MGEGPGAAHTNNLSVAHQAPDSFPLGMIRAGRGAFSSRLRLDTSGISLSSPTLLGKDENPPNESGDLNVDILEVKLNPKPRREEEAVVVVGGGDRGKWERFVYPALRSGSPPR